jgi:thiamine biosynthesis protein ThiI
MNPPRSAARRRPFEAGTLAPPLRKFSRPDIIEAEKRGGARPPRKGCLKLEEVLLLKLGELVLKGLNRKRFEEKLLREVVRMIRPYGDFAVESRQSVVTVSPAAGADLDGACAACARVFGVLSLTRARAVPKDMAAILPAAAEYLREPLLRARSFKAEARRSDKSFPLSSPEIAQAVGGGLHGLFPHLSVDVRCPEVEVMVEIRDRAAYIHGSPQPGAGGLPLDSGGRAMLLLSGGIDSPAAGYMIAKRGVLPLPVHFYSYPYTSPEALDKVKAIARLLSGWIGPVPLRLVPFTAVQEEIRRRCPEAYFTLVSRRFMMDIAARLAVRAGAGALVTGESLGQVASQTLEALGVIEKASALPVLRPLVGLDKEEIVRLARRIGTFETSILPYEDCCTVFTPRHPKTNPRLEAVLEAEKALDREALIERTLAGTEMLHNG